MSIAEQMDALIESRGVPKQEAMFRTGITLAKVTNITDPEKFNRVKCLPIDADEKDETDWCYVMAPMGGKDRGMFFFPQVDDLVVLAYLDGDPHRPLVLGSYWNTEQTPPLTVQDGKNEDYLLRTPQKIEMKLHDKKGEECLTITMPSGVVIQVDDKEKKLEIHDKESKNQLEMSFKEGAITIKAEKKLTLDVGKGKAQIVLSEDGNIQEKGEGKLTEKFKNVETKADSSVSIAGSSSGIKLEGTNIEGKANSQLKLEGSMATLKSNGMLEVSASGIATVKGSMLKLN